MTPNTFSVQFIIRTDRQDKKGYVPIYAKITLNGDVTRISINHSIRPDDWIADKEQAKVTTAALKIVNEAIEAYKSKIYQAYSKIVAVNEPLT